MGMSSKDKRDIYYRMAKVEGFRARSAYKLIQIFEETGIMAKYDDDTITQFLLSKTCNICKSANGFPYAHQTKNIDSLNLFTRIVDLCSAPGSWSQLVSSYVDDQHQQIIGICKKITKCNQNICNNLIHYTNNHKIVSVDLQEMAPLPNVHFIRGDITDMKVLQEVLNHFNPPNAENGEDFDHSTNEIMKADLVLCDGAPDVSGLHEIDGFIQSELVRYSLSAATHVLKLGGTYISKIFRTEKYPFIASRMQLLFDKVKVIKPSASRNSSVEAFIVAQGFRGNIENLSQMLEKPLFNNNTPLFESAGPSKAGLVPFIACGDLSSFDSDRNYPLDEYQPLGPVQPPITAPYIKQ